MTGSRALPDVTPVVVIGGGVGGLVVALELARAGHQPVLVEAAERCGGVLSSHRVGGLTLDAGAESFATVRPAVADLLGELGLAGRITPPNPVGAWVRHRAGSAPLPATGFLGIPGRPWAADLRRVIGLPGVVRCAVDTVLPTRSGLAAGATIGGLVRSRMGTRVLDRLVEPVAGGVYAADPESLEIQTVAPGLGSAMQKAGSLAGAVRLLRAGGERSGSAVATLRGGLHTLVNPLVDAVEAAGGQVRTGASVQDLTRAEPGWRITLGSAAALSATTGSSATTVLAATAVVLALPAPQAARLLESAVPAMPASVLLAPIAPVLICTLVVDDDRLDHAPRGTGVLVSAHAVGVRAKALTHATAKWPWLAELAGPGRHVLRLSYGRGEELPAGDLAEIALADASELLGVTLSPAAVVDSAVVRWTSALPAPRPGHAEAARALREALAPLGVSVVGAAVAGSGLAGVVTDARLQAAAMVARLSGVARVAPDSATAAENPACG